MPHSQSATNVSKRPADTAPNYLQPRLTLHNFDIAKAIHQRKLTLDMSQLMGCDYIFVTHFGANELLSPKRIATSIQELIEILEVTAQQAVVILVDKATEVATFTRCDFRCLKGRVEVVITSKVTHPEQLDFIQMMYDCSTTY